MLIQLALGSVVISATIVIQVLFIALADERLDQCKDWIGGQPALPRAVLTLVAVTLWLMAAMSLGVWCWALAFLAVGVFEAVEPAVYFSVVAFTTLGFGDVLVAEDWRLLSGMAAANGLLIFGLSTAFHIEVIRAIRSSHGRDRR